MEKIAVIDLFCGAGGTTTGIERAKMFGKKIAKVIACVNHDAMAIKSHRFNHKGVLHFTEDIRTLNLDRLIKIVDKYRKMGYRVAIWASLECTNFSNAKGGAPRDADSRTLAEHLLRYIYSIDPDYVFIENVMEFMSWGPLNELGKPISRDKGIDYIKWRDSIKAIGYHHDWAKLDSADFGARTTRKRYFGVFAKLNLPISFPKPTHSKDPNKYANLFSKPLKKWKPVKDMLDLEDEGTSIFNRKKDLVDKTINVIMKGIVKAMEENENAFLFKYYGSGDNLNSINNPAGTITTKDRFAKIQIIFNQYKNSNLSSIDRPIGTITTTPKANLVSFIMNLSHGGHTTSINKPCPVIIARQDKAPLYLIKTLMDEHGIVDIKMRMLKVPELLKIQGFPSKYVLKGNQSQQKKFIGNSVVPLVAELLIKQIYMSLCEQSEIKNAA